MTTMMGRGADGGCGTEEKTCPVSRISPSTEKTPVPAPASAPDVSPEKSERIILGVDLYSQALKALSERSPFDSDEVLANTNPTLPSGLASLLIKQVDSRRKHKRSHTEAKSSRKGSKEKKSIWGEVEDYFREITLQDIERLYRFSSSFESSLVRKNSCFTIPYLGYDRRNPKKVEVELPDKDSARARTPALTQAPEPAPMPALAPAPAVGVVEEAEQGKVTTLDSLVSLEGDSNGKSDLGMEIDNESGGILAAVEGNDLHLPNSSSLSCSSAEWVLGSRSRVLLTTTRPTKKRKLLGENAGLERLNVAQPCERSSTLCHVCSVGDTGDQLNQLVVCSSCHVVVHKKCYGVQGEVDKSWMCSWCKHLIDVKAGRAVGRDRPCALCPKQGGALKRFRIGSAGSDESAEFAHLFCSQWMPEVYIDDTRLMEPLLSVDGVKEIRGKLVCNLCKVKLGSCIRCSDGSCRTSFHPICAREAGNKMEIWGKFGCDDIELRAFCAKHSCSVVDSVKNQQNHPVVSELATSNQPPVLSVNKIKKLKIGCKNGDKLTFHIGGGESKPKLSEEAASQVAVLKDANANFKSGVGDGQELSDVKTLERGLNEDAKTSNLGDLGKVLKKLVDCGKVSLEQLASDVDISADTLAATLTSNHLAPEMYNKMFKWLRDHAYMDICPKDTKVKVRPSVPSKAGTEDADSSDAVGVRNLDISDVVAFKSVPPRRRTVGNIRIFKEGKVISLWNDETIGNANLTGGVGQEHMDGDHDDLHKDSIVDILEKNIDEAVGLEDSPKEPSPGAESTLVNPNDHCQADCNGAEDGTFSQNSLLDLDQGVSSISSLDIVSQCDRSVEPGTELFVHPYVQKKLVEAQCWVKQGAHHDFHGSGKNKRQFLNANVFSTDDKLSGWPGNGERINGFNLGDLSEASKKEAFELFPEDELEGEIVYFQQRLLSNAIQRKCCTDQLICQAVRSLPHEISAARKRKWDDVLVNQYIYELKEARKQGRKEKKHKEAQAVLAAATAAAAASSRNSSLRKDVDESPYRESQLKLESSRVRGGGISLQLVPRARETNSSLTSCRAVSDRCSDFFQYTAGSPKEHPKSCDVCRRAESILNSILVCSSCKVAVHLNCYRSAKESIGPWYCELCEESSSSKISSATMVHPIEKSSTASCGLCGASKGAFRKSSNGQWVHAVCAEWVFDSTFKRGQVHPVEGMETVTKGNDVCAVCQDRYGVCIKCHYGNCQSTFHPYCARSAGYYMYARSIGGGKMQHKAYCSKHSLEQKAKAETQRHAAEDLKTAKQYRVELEKLRLLCERIVKREKLKRELVLCSHEILASRREAVAVSRFVRRPYISHEMSSESATTSLKGDVDGSRSCSEAFEKADDVTVDSALSVKRVIRLPLSIDSDQRTDDSSTSQLFPTPKPSDRISFSGKKLPIRAVLACPNFPQNGEKTLNSRKHAEPSGKELVMTSDQASKRNSLLPNGYKYVPIDYLSDGKQVDNRGSDESEKLDE